MKYSSFTIKHELLFTCKKIQKLNSETALKLLKENVISIQLRKKVVHAKAKIIHDPINLTMGPDNRTRTDNSGKSLVP